MTDRFPPGTRVRTFPHDPPHHTRLPRYARGKSGVVVEPEGRAELADVSARGRGDAPVEQVYAVRFAARAWTDQAYREQLLTDGAAAVRPGTRLRDSSPS